MKYQGNFSSSARQNPTRPLARTKALSHRPDANALDTVKTGRPKASAASAKGLIATQNTSNKESAKANHKIAKNASSKPSAAKTAAANAAANAAAKKPSAKPFKLHSFINKSLFAFKTNKTTNFPKTGEFSEISAPAGASGAAVATRPTRPAAPAQKPAARPAAGTAPARPAAAAQKPVARPAAATAPARAAATPAPTQKPAARPAAGTAQAASAPKPVPKPQTTKFTKTAKFSAISMQKPHTTNFPKTGGFSEISAPAPQPSQLYTATRVDASERLNLLELTHDRLRSLSPHCFTRTLALYGLLVLVLSAYIFVRELIYDTSKEYAELRAQREMLIEENRQLARKIEALQFKNKITNYFEVQYE